MRKVKGIIALFAMITLFAINLVPVKAQIVSTGIHSSTGTYNLYIRESGSTESLGRMSLYSKGSYAYNDTILYADCDSMTLHVSGKSGVYTQMFSQSRNDMKAYQGFYIRDYGVFDSNGLMRVYGCTELSY